MVAALPLHTLIAWETAVNAGNECIATVSLETKEHEPKVAEYVISYTPGVELSTEIVPVVGLIFKVPVPPEDIVL